MKNWLVTIRTYVGVYYFTVAALTRNEADNAAQRLCYLLAGTAAVRFEIDMTFKIEEI